MKRNYYLMIMLFMLLLPSLMNSQDYLPVREGNISFFSNLEGLRVDSVKQTTEGTEYYFQKTWNFSDNIGSYHFAIMPTGPSWLGHKCIVSDDGTQSYIIDEKDTCTLKPFNPIGESWTIDQFIAKNGQTYTITGTVDGRIEKQFLGILDSVIVIKLKIHDEQGLEVQIPDSSTVEISKNYGLIRMFQFYNFVKHPDQYHIDYSQTFSLIGLTNPAVGRVFLTPRQIYDFNIGDEFHYYREGVVLQENYQWSYSSIKKVVEKYVSADTDTIIYTFDLLKRIKSPVWGEAKIDSFYAGVETQKYIFDNKFYLPLEPFFYLDNDDEYANYRAYGGRIYFYRVSLREDGRIESSSEENGEYIEQTTDNTWELGLHHNGGTELCGEGIGVVYTGYEAMFDWGYTKLVYYKKGDEVWGTPFTFTSVKDVPSGELEIFPNPIKAGENLTISKLGEGIHSVGIYNTLGIEVYSNDNIYDNQSIKISPLPVGMYFINIRSGSEVRTEKIIVY